MKISALHNYKELNKSRFNWIVIAFSICVIILVIFTRLRLLSVPLERDEGEYAYFAQLLLKGIPPYLHAYSMKFPGIYGAFALIMVFFGQSTEAIHKGLLLVDLISALLLFRLAKQLFNSTIGALSAAFFAFMAVGPSLLGMAAHATHFVVLFILASLATASPSSPNNSVRIFVSGLSAGMSVLMKQQAIFLIPFIIWFLIINDSNGRGFRLRPDSLKRASAFSAGILLPIIIVFYLMYVEGVFDKFWFWTISYARQYVSEVSFWGALDSFFSATAYVIKPQILLWLISAYGAYLCFKQRKRQNCQFVLAFLLFSFLSICPGFYFRWHYYILLLPPVALCAAIAVVSVIESKEGKNFAWIPPMILILPIIATLILNAGYFFFWSPNDVSRKIYGANPFPESVVIARYIRNNSAENAKIAVLGSEPQIYFYADRLSASGHIYMYGLMEHQPFSGQMQREFIKDIEKTEPEFVVLVRVQTSWLMDYFSDKTILTWQRNGYLKKNYDRVGIINIDETSRYFWGKDIEKYKNRLTNYIFIYKRKR